MTKTTSKGICICICICMGKQNMSLTTERRILLTCIAHNEIYSVLNLIICRLLNAIYCKNLYMENNVLDV